MGPVFMTSLAHFTSMTWYSGSRGIRYTIGALIIAYTILGLLTIIVIIILVVKYTPKPCSNY